MGVVYAAFDPELDRRVAVKVLHHVGTPVYMAPEQHLGRDVDARADQFAFCVAPSSRAIRVADAGGSR